MTQTMNIHQVEEVRMHRMSLAGNVELLTLVIERVDGNEIEITLFGSVPGQPPALVVDHGRGVPQHARVTYPTAEDLA